MREDSSGCVCLAEFHGRGRAKIGPGGVRDVARKGGRMQAQPEVRKPIWVE